MFQCADTLLSCLLLENVIYFFETAVWHTSGCRLVLTRVYSSVSRNGTRSWKAARCNFKLASVTSVCFVFGEF